MSTHLVECPFCRGRLEVDAGSGKVVNKWDAKKKSASGDSMKDAFEKLKADQEKRKNFFETAKEELERRKREADEKFEREKERINREGDVSRPPNPFDLD
jgi:hypothetical protein